jgi:hypothetical protein
MNLYQQNSVSSCKTLLVVVQLEQNSDNSLNVWADSV